MSTTSYMSEIIDAAVKDISKRVAKLEVVNVDSIELDTGDSNSLVAVTKGDYQITIVFNSGMRVLKAIAENMKHGQAVGEHDIAIYTTEFFNILCGHLVTVLNNQTHASARFTIPRLVKGDYFSGQSPDSLKGLIQLNYSSDYGALRLQTAGGFPSAAS